MSLSRDRTSRSLISSQIPNQLKQRKKFCESPPSPGICKLESQKEFWNQFTDGHKNNHFRLLWSASVHYQKSFAQSQAVFMSEKVLGYAAVWVRERREIKSICWIRFCEMFCAMSKGSLSLARFLYREKHERADFYANWLIINGPVALFPPRTFAALATSFMT